MSKGPRYRVPLRRRREGSTDYRKRLSLLKAGKPRLVVRNTLGNTMVQFVLFDVSGDRVVASALSKELGRYSWDGPTGNVPAAYLTGYLAARRALAAGLKEAVLDAGLHSPSKGGRVSAALTGVLGGGVRVPHSEEALSQDSRVRGEHILKEMSKQFDKVKAELEAI